MTYSRSCLFYIVADHSNRHQMQNNFRVSVIARDTPGNTVGLSWQGTMCNPRWRCSIAKGVNLNNWIEIHETGHR